MASRDHDRDSGTEKPRRVQGGWGAPTGTTGGASPASQPHGNTTDQANEMESEGQAVKPGSPDGSAPDQDEHEGATEDQVGDRGGPAVGYDEGARQKNRPH